MTKIIQHDPFRSFLSRPRWVDEIEDSFNSQRGLKIHETADKIIVEAVVAGIPADSVEVTIEDGVLAIKAESNNESETKEGFRSSSYQYYYTAALSGGEWDKANAEIEHGVMTLTIPKAKAAQPQKIKVTSKQK